MAALSNLSYLHVPPGRPYNYNTVTQIARENARLRPNQELLIIRELDGSRYTLTNASLYQQAEHLARYLVTLGVKRGDIVGLVGPNSLEKAIGSLGIMLAGAIIWNANINLKTAQDVMAQIQLLQARVMLVDCGKDNCFLPPVKAMLDHYTVQTDSANEDTDIKVTYLRKTDDNMSETLERIQSLQLDQIELPIIYPEDDAIVLPTSGSTGKSKIVRHSHFSLYKLPSSQYSVCGDVGRPFPGVEIRIVDHQDIPIEKGMIGKIQVRSPYAMKKYDRNPELTKRAFTEEKWYRTGDLGNLSRDGNLVIVGREADVISRGCKTIYPGVLESLLKGMTSIKDVCVVPVPDKRLLEEVCACFVSSGQVNPEDVKKFFEQKLFKEQTQNNLSEIPTYFLQFEAFPEVGNGKFDRKTIRRDAIARLGLTKAHASMNK
ncbi:polyketide synthase PksJ-like [Pecten maximus]|uniref:polyketide synthase PksJ-like n=1 Tax=Pecten maximus TaxID=6579 RepID=UPI0014584DA6|nr:polyketide synthase PksJ-like [Pecten maximus]